MLSLYSQFIRGSSSTSSQSDKCITVLLLLSLSSHRLEQVQDELGSEEVGWTMAAIRLRTSCGKKKQVLYKLWIESKYSRFFFYFFLWFIHFPLISWLEFCFKYCVLKSILIRRLECVATCSVCGNFTLYFSNCR